MIDTANTNYNTYKYTKIYVFILFFIFGGITSLNSILIPKLQNSFSLTYLQAMLVEAVFFSCYFLFSIPAGMLIQRYGYIKSICIALLILSIGCILFITTTYITTFEVFLIALCILAIGVVILQVALNPLVSLLGSPKTTSSRLIFAQSFNSLGTTVFPYISSILILGNLTDTNKTILQSELEANQYHTTSVISQMYLTISVFLLLVTFLFWRQRNNFTEPKIKYSKFFQIFTILKKPQFAMGAACIFLYVGAEVAIGSIMVNYLMRQDTLFLGSVSAGQHTALYWGSAMIGRFLGCWILSRFSDAKNLCVCCLTAFALVIISACTVGFISGWSLIIVGLFNSIMFPTIFSLATVDLKDRKSEGSSIICTTISGGVVIPLIFGYMADITTLREALIIPAICYMIIAAYGIFCLDRKSGSSAEIE
ncbi:Glucose/galactose transporter [Candidatus Liberibacter solanacearum]|uniref:sugar MFS transporter n=1 Tax=Candidatus Liberibacter solanacearum TaxID=556287 RepID=UPI0038727648